MVPYACLSLALALTFHCAQAQALTLRLCVNQVAQAPHTTPDGDGIADRLIKKAAAEIGLAIAYHTAPASRCREELRHDVADAYPTVPYTPSLVTFISFPMQEGGPDPARAVVTVRNLLFRRVGTQVDWDGKRFSHLSSNVLVLFGASLMQDRLRGMDVPFDASGKTARANFDKLLAGRGDLVAGLDAGAGLLALPEYAGRIELLPVAFSNEAYYLGLSRHFVALHPDVAERLWDAIARIRRTPAFEAEARAVTQKSLLREE